jgi:hypothetical protein
LFNRDFPSLGITANCIYLYFFNYKTNPNPQTSPHRSSPWSIAFLRFSVVSWVRNEGETTATRRADLLNRDFPGLGITANRIYLQFF